MSRLPLITLAALMLLGCGAETATDTTARREAAWCGIDEGQQPHAAWCGLDTDARPRAAWCGVDPGGRNASEADAPRHPH